MCISNNIVWFFRDHLKKEPGHENRLYGCHEHRGYRLLRGDCIARGLVHTNYFKCQECGLRRSGSPGGHIDRDCDRLFDSVLNAGWCYEAGTG